MSDSGMDDQAKAVDAIIADCVPAGHYCDPQAVADALRPRLASLLASEARLRQALKGAAEWRCAVREAAPPTASREAKPQEALEIPQGERLRGLILDVLRIALHEADVPPDYRYAIIDIVSKRITATS